MINLTLDFYHPKGRPSLEIKKDAEHFIVEEISNFGVIDLNVDCSIFKEEEGKFTWFVLKKKNWPTDKAIRSIAKYLHISHKRFNWAGTKDKKAITTQLCSVFNVDKEEIRGVKIKDITIPCSFTQKDKIKLGELIGNRFSIFMESKHYETFKSNFQGKFPNYFGVQRFGIRKNTHKIGYFLVKEEYEEAMYLFLTDTSYETNLKAINARKDLEENGDFSRAFNKFPKHLYLERMLLYHLKDHENDYVNAFRKLPRATLLTFVHALQSYIFNKELSIRFKENSYDFERQENEYTCSKNNLGFPDVDKEGEDFLVGNVVGYETELNSYEEEILNSINLDIEDFSVKSFPEISARGARRVFLPPVINPSFSNNYFSFSLPSGSYATSFLENFFELV